ncbi:MAG: PD-(D/E)XK nuclease family protein, partial [Clostridia bacterium]|nr:PD-(D/E)XK nuclease family protein [Clostridia bacterium]
VQIFMNLLRVIDNRRQDIPLMSVLRSPIGGFSTDELILLVSNYRTGENDAILDALLRAADDGTSLGEKCRILLGNIENWQNECRLLGLCEFLDLLLAQTHFYEYVSALCGGEVRSSNLDALIMRAQDFTLNGSNSLSAFITYMDKANKYGSVSAVQKSTSDVVSIMSIHKSKGLEYPVVILAGLDAKFNSSESGNTVLMDSELGIGLRLTSGNKRFDTFYRKSIALRLANKNTAERMRLLYVAMTRAKEQLIMVGALKDIEKRCLSVPKTLTKERAMRANTFLDWLIHLKIQPHIHLAPTASLSCEALDESLYRKFTVQASLPVSDNSMSPFAWSYPFMAATKVPSKVSVSKLDGNVLSSRILPDFVIQKEGVFNAAQRGTATHTVMEHITIMPHTFESVEKEIARLVLEGHLLKEEAEAVNRASIVGFFASDIGRRLCASDRIERELKFNHRINASAVMDAPDDEKILLQGMIDCCFIEDGEWVILDYKTDYIAYPSEKYEAAQKHKKQVSLYADALFALSGIQVKEKYVCFLRLKDGCVKL